MASDYEAALEAFCEASRAFTKKTQAYRERKISDAEFLEARAVFEAAQLACDAADALEEQRYLRLISAKGEP
jgi:hypothetical protein